MKLGTLLTINAIVAILFGIAFVLMPATLTSYYGITLSPAGLYVGQLFGATLLGFAVLTWSSRNAGESEARQAIVLALFLSHTVALVLSLLAQFAGTVNALGWSTIVIYLLLALGFAYFQFMKPSSI